MWRKTRFNSGYQLRQLHATIQRHQSTDARPIVSIGKGTFYRRYPSTQDTPEGNPALFPDLTFQLPNGKESTTAAPQYWSVVSPSSQARTTFLQILAGQHICLPPTARSYPYLSARADSPHHAIKYVGFDAERGTAVGGTGVRGAYLSSRYESRREVTDFTLRDYLMGQTELNALERVVTEDEKRALDEAVSMLNLAPLLSMPVANLSNGQTRRARIAKALMARPEVLLLDGPFMGLDPRTLTTMSDVLRDLAERQRPRVVMSLRPEDGVPKWMSHIIVVDEQLQVLAQGQREDVLSTRSTVPATRKIVEAARRGHEGVSNTKVSRDGFFQTSPTLPPGEALVEIDGAKVSYGNKTVLGGWSETIDGQPREGLWWSLHRGQRCGIFGPNGSGKTTMLSLITSDHPQTYSAPIKLFGRTRLPTQGRPGIGIFDIQQRMGHSSPEIHAFFPKAVSVRRALESAWADTPISTPKLTEDARARVDGFLRWFSRELNPTSDRASLLELLEPVFQDGDKSEKQLEYMRNAYTSHIATRIDLAWADELCFRDLTFSSQRLILFLRALIKSPDLVILDEALSGIDEGTRDKALLFLSHGETVTTVNEDHNSAPKPSLVARLGLVQFTGLTERQALLVISHAREDVPGCVREWICLPEAGEGKAPRTGELPGPLELNPKGWEDIWGR